MAPFVTFIGRHDSGKTTLARRVARHLLKKGYRVAVLKSTKETGLLPDDPPGTDTAGYREEGVAEVALVAPDGMVLRRKGLRESPRALAFRLFPDADIVLGEGFKHAEGVPKIEVARAEVSRSLLREEVPGVVAVAADFSVEGTSFDLADHAGVARFIEERFLRPGGGAAGRPRLLVDGREVPLNAYVRGSLAGVLWGFIGALRGTAGAVCAEIRLCRGRSRRPGA
ncbi:molybdopterin-guanine dinucleotide biosynthesis protein B [Dissulfurirhabdus thermomarina]|uniref:Molybdopterin-guanine dinucleotide biosynthesis protein B n=1 Tax=Dissulfurirhabdus thermomarina TaxID=1765737 RepID=A0A6N9TMM6_DISTH|nr:molybdopterin-guanine dinucleotide biosynthesis protein B [Dissulfurirhabdus thermomarina]NDY41690.1 molybdopterin-guanine dinucleotide biosynthesis protein B [Dissulfurirhabdus thermomarina]